MTLTIELPPEVEEALRLQAAQSGQDVGTFVVQSVREKIARAGSLQGAGPALDRAGQGSGVSGEDPTDEAFERESHAFDRLLPKLLQTRPGLFVAIYEGQIIDEDGDEFALARRIERTHRSEFVLIRQVSRNFVDHLLQSPEES